MMPCPAQNDGDAQNDNKKSTMAFPANGAAARALARPPLHVWEATAHANRDFIPKRIPGFVDVHSQKCPLLETCEKTANVMKSRL